jgi:hypothetical protein
MRGHLASNMRLSVLRSLLRPILSALGMSSEPKLREFQLVEFPPDRQDVTNWRNNLIDVYRASPSSRLRMMETLTVLEVRHFKSTHHPQHEYVVAIILDGTDKRYLRIERTKQKTIPERPDLANASENILSSSSDSLDILSRDARDLVHTITAWGVDECLRTASFVSCSQKPRLFDLALLSSVAHEHSPLYSLFWNQCYWFADIIILVLEDVYPGAQITIHSKGSPEGDEKLKEDIVLAPKEATLLEVHANALQGNIGDEECLRGSGRKAGTWFRVPIYWKRRTLAKTLAMHFRNVQEDEMSLV